MRSQEEPALGGLDDFASLLLGAADLSLPEILAAHPSLIEDFSSFDHVHTAAVLGGLLTAPELQCNCCRLEALSHIAVAFAKGKRKPSKTAVASWFSEMSAGPCGRSEDPAEDAFVSLVVTPRGNFRILEGIWESAGFFLQRIVNVVEGLPRDGNWTVLKESVYSLLRLSDLICERAELPRYTFGASIPKARLPSSIRAALLKYRQHVTFSDADLRAHDLLLAHLAPFVLDSELRASIPAGSLSHSPLLHHPLLRRVGEVVVALPTAISVAIRAMVVGSMINAGFTGSLLAAIAQEYSQFFSNNSPLGSGRGAPIHFERTDNGMMASYAQEVDTGRFLHLIFVLDTLEGFEESGFAWTNQNPFSVGDDLDRWIDKCRRAVVQTRHFREGLTLIIGCGVGRAAAHILPNTQRNDWLVAYLSAADLATLSSLGEVTPTTLWRILDAQNRLARQGVQLLNMNGLLNLASWVRSLDGHLVRHSQVPDEFNRGGMCHLAIDQSMVREIRMEVAKRVDRHAVETVEGQWLEVRKLNESPFDEDRSLPLYVGSKWDDECGLPIVFVTRSRSWWCKVTHPLNLQRLKIMTTWLPKITTVLDRELMDLPSGPLSLLVRFEGYAERHAEGESPSKEEIQNKIKVQVDLDHHVVTIRTDEAFERGLATHTNLAEAALVGAIVSGCALLAGRTDSDQAVLLQEEIVRDEHARSCHAFWARHFRDFVRGSLPKHPTTVDAIDDATLRLGLGWRTQRREGGSKIEGKATCTAFLNGLVASLEEDLCSDLRHFNRQSLIELALRNHEAAMVDEDMWHNTAAANLALHDDKMGVMRTIAEHGFKTKAAQMASRVLVEVAVCECPLQHGNPPGQMDLSRLMAKLLLAADLGGLSDAIHFEAMSPSLRITPLGDVHTDLSFFDNVLKPFGHLTSNTMLKSSISAYPSNFDLPAPVTKSEPAFDPGFVAAWKDEHIFSLDDVRGFVDTVEDFGIERKQAVFTMRRSELRSLFGDSVLHCHAIAEALTTMPRARWRAPPDGFNARDIHPWRFRRRLSLMRCPIVQVDDLEDPTLVIAPGLLRDAMVYCVRGYYEGSFPLAQVKSTTMRSWFGHAAERRGSEFNAKVATRMADLGWRVERNVPVTKVLQKRLNKDYGDVDVLAWNDSTGRVLFIECKDLHFHKTTGELAEQLSDFRGKTRNGRSDLLKKHLDRCRILREHGDLVALYLKLTSSIPGESWVVFRNPVPMLFAWKDLENAVHIGTYDQLEEI